MIANKAFLSLEKDFQPIVQTILEKLEKKGWYPIVAEGRRTPTQQAEKVKRGVSTTLKSVHLTGLAADIVDSRYMWNIDRVHQFWLDLFDAAQEIEVPHVRIRCGMIWDKPEREAIYRKALATKKYNMVNWFCDVAHIEMHRV